MTADDQQQPNADALELPDELAPLIGHFVAGFGAVELLLEGIIWHLTKLPYATGRLFTARLDTRPKIELIDALRSQLPVNEAAMAWDAAKSLIIDLQPHRNNIVHGAWTNTPFFGNAIFSTRRAAAGQSVRPLKYTVENLTFLCAETRKAINHLRAIHRAFRSP